jgi:2-keto-4-pentenoate hydratase
MNGYLYHNGKEIMNGNTRNILGNPLAAVAWLVNRISEFDIGLEAGQVIMPGSCLRAMPMDKGHYKCEYQGWGAVEFEVV